MKKNFIYKEKSGTVTKVKLVTKIKKLIAVSQLRNKVYYNDVKAII